MQSYFDAHCDTISKSYDQKTGLFDSSNHLDLNSAKNIKKYAQVFAIWLDDKLYAKDNAVERFFSLYNFFTDQTQKNSDKMIFCKNKKDYDSALESGKIAAFLSIEGAIALGDELDNIEGFHELGVRLMTLTWNFENFLGSGVFSKNTDEKLTVYGKQAVARMKKLNMIIDVSHLNEAGFWDVMSMEGGIVVASHSNSKTVCSHRRNLSDEQFRAIVNTGGGCGINLFPGFLAPVYKNSADVRDIIKHIEHFLSLGGQNAIFIGADFDGIDTLCTDIDCPCSLNILREELMRLNYNDNLIEDIFYNNLERLMLKSLI